MRRRAGRAAPAGPPPSVPVRGTRATQGPQHPRHAGPAPELAQAYHTFNGHVLFGTTLSTRQRELLVLRVAAVRQCAYEWNQHVVLAGDAGLTARRGRPRSPRPRRPWVVAARAGDAPRGRRAAGRRPDRRRHVGGLWRPSSTSSSSWTWSSPSAPTTCWPWPSSPSAIELDDDLRDNALLFWEMRAIVWRQRPTGGTDPMPHFAKPAEGSWTEHYPELGTGPVDYEDSISPELLRARARGDLRARPG